MEAILLWRGDVWRHDSTLNVKGINRILVPIVQQIGTNNPEKKRNITSLAMDKWVLVVIINNHKIHVKKQVTRALSMS